MDDEAAVRTLDCEDLQLPAALVVTYPDQRLRLGSGPADVTMTMTMVTSETLPLAEIKARLSEIVDRVERDRIVLTRNGRPAAVIISPQDLDALEDTLDLLSDPEAVAEIESSRADVAAGRVLGAEQLRAKYLKSR